MSNFKKENLKFQYKNLEKGSPCILDFGINGIIKNCIVDTKMYTEGCVYYDIRVYPHVNYPLDFTIIQGVRSLYVQEDNENYISKYIINE